MSEATTGRKGYREPHEPPDDRPVIAYGACRCRGCREYGGDFWRNESERLTYEHAVEANPKGASEGALTYIARIAGIVEQRKQAAAAKEFPPSSRLSPVEFHERQVELEAQREKILPPPPIETA